jgi:leucyl-tRNA synthetase
MVQFGAQIAFRRTLSFVETEVLKEIVPHIKKSLALVDVEILSVEEALAKTDEPSYTKNIIEISEPGNPAFEYHNVKVPAL